MTKTFEQAIAEAQKQFAENCQAIVEQYRKYPDGFTFASKGGWRGVVAEAKPYLYGDTDWMDLHEVGICYDVDSPNFPHNSHPVSFLMMEYEIDAAIAYK